MTILDIVTFPDKFLKRPTNPVENIDGALQEVIHNMGDTMYQAPGVGLAAIQVGIDQSMLIYDISPAEEGRSMNVLVNPRIIESEGEILSENEGCLSVPEYRSDVKRFASILVEAYDQNEKPLRFEAHEFLSIVLQHEIDHLNGKLFIDRISPLKRQLYARRVQKRLKRNKKET
jgi:peptide deformylase